MRHEQEARTRQAMEEKIHNLKKMLKDMEADFAECAKTDKSPCFFCANDDICDCENCNFKWNPHN